MSPAGCRGWIAKPSAELPRAPMLVSRREGPVIYTLFGKQLNLMATRWFGQRAASASYQAVTVAATAHCCAAARATRSRPLLVAYFPKVPLPGCTMPERCRCELLEWPDRRIGERRLPDTDSGHDATGVQRRLHAQRRKSH
jgi:hypothetical protein